MAGRLLRQPPSRPHASSAALPAASASSCGPRPPPSGAEPRQALASGHAHTLLGPWLAPRARGSRLMASDTSDQSSYVHEEDGSVTIQDDLDALLQVLPPDIRQPLVQHKNRAYLLEVVLDLGRRPEARFLGHRGGECLRDTEIARSDLAAAEAAVGNFGGDNRAGVPGTLHRISAIRNRKGGIVGLTCRVGRAVTGHIDMIRDILGVPNSLLFIGKPGVGKTTVIREMARILADDFHKRVVIVDTSNELGGDGDIPHPAIGGARRMQVPDPSQQHRVMVEAVENHMPEIVIVDEIGTEAEAAACRTIAERGVQLIGTAHGQVLENLLKNPTLSDLVGGIQPVTLGDDEAAARGTQKTVLERKAPATFPVVIEMHDRAFWVTHWTEDSVDCLLNGKDPVVQVRRREGRGKTVLVEEVRYGDVLDRRQAAAEAGAGPAELSAAAGAAAAADGGGGGGDGGGGSDGGGQPVIEDLPAPTFGSSFRSDADDPFAWVHRLHSVPDKDALQELAQLGYSSNDRNGSGRKLRKRGGRS